MTVGEVTPPFVWYGRGFGGDADELGILVPADDVVALERDRILCGNVFLAPTDVWHDGARVYTRRPPTEFIPSWADST